jgi:hypothetical protein
LRIVISLTGEKAASYLITGPGWNGTVPAGLKALALPTSPKIIQDVVALI